MTVIGVVKLIISPAYNYCACQCGRNNAHQILVYYGQAITNKIKNSSGSSYTHLQHSFAQSSIA